MSSQVHRAEALRGGPPPRHLHDNPVLCYMWRKMHMSNKNLMVAIVGDVGDGKSWAALRLGEVLDPTFNAEHACFRPSRLLERIRDDHPMGDITVADEAGVSLDAHTWYESDQIKLSNVLDTWRHQNRGLIFTLPVFSGLQKSARQLVDVLMTAYGIDNHRKTSKWRVQAIQTNNRTGDIYTPYIQAKDARTGQTNKYQTMMLDKPDPTLIENYEERKEEYTAEINQDAVEEAMDEETPEKELKSKDIVEKILSNGGVEEVTSTNNHTGEEYIDKALIRAEYDLPVRKADEVKSLIEKRLDA